MKRFDLDTFHKQIDCYCLLQFDAWKTCITGDASWNNAELQLLFTHRKNISKENADRRLKKIIEILKVHDMAVYTKNDMPNLWNLVEIASKDDLVKKVALMVQLLGLTRCFLLCIPEVGLMIVLFRNSKDMRSQEILRHIAGIIAPRKMRKACGGIRRLWDEKKGAEYFVRLHALVAAGLSRNSAAIRLAKQFRENKDSLLRNYRSRLDYYLRYGMDEAALNRAVRESLL